MELYNIPYKVNSRYTSAINRPQASNSHITWKAVASGQPKKRFLTKNILFLMSVSHCKIGRRLGHTKILIPPPLLPLPPPPTLLLPPTQSFAPPYPPFSCTSKNKPPS